MGLVLLLAGIHGLKIGSTLALSWPLKIYILGWMGIGLTSALVRLFNLRLKFHQHDYHVSEVKVVKDWIMMKLSPENKALKYEPGQFVFLRFDSLGISPESHPFSLAGNPTEKFLTIVVKSFGSYTETLKLLKVDAKVKVEGPYGRFNQKYGQFKKQIWIAGGIGVTPFRSMTSQLDGYDIRLFYCVNNKEEAWFDEEFRQINNPNFAYKLWVSKEMGYITADKIGEIDNCEVFICGPTPMMRSLTSQFKKLRVKNSNIHSEEFELY